MSTSPVIKVNVDGMTRQEAFEAAYSGWSERYDEHEAKVIRELASQWFMDGDDLEDIDDQVLQLRGSLALFRVEADAKARTVIERLLDELFSAPTEGERHG